MKCKGIIDKIVKGEKTYQTAEELELCMRTSKSVFSEEEAFTEPNVAEAHEGFQEDVVQKRDVGRLL